MFNRKKKNTDVSNETLEIKQAEIQELREKYEVLQNTFAELYEEYEHGNRNLLGGRNKYRSLEKQVTEIIKKFNSEAEYGCELTQRIIGLLSALTLPNGVQAVVDPAVIISNPTAGKAELAYITSWLDKNNLDQSGSLDLAQEAQMQGRVVLTLSWEKTKGVVRAKYRSWIDDKYEIKYANEDGFPPYKLKGSEKLENSTKDYNFDDDSFVFLLLNGRYGKLEGRPRLASILNVLENLSADLADWREGNKFFAHKTPYFKCENAAEVTATTNEIKKTRWRVGTSMAGTADLNLVGGDSSGSLEQSIQTSISIISAATGISPHFLGFPQLLSNRSTADAMGEPLEIVIKSEVKRWYSFFEELFVKIIRMRNNNMTNGVKLQEDIIKPKIVGLSDRQYDAIKTIWLPALAANGISLRTFIAQLPIELNPDEEIARIQEQKDNGVIDFAQPQSGYAGNKEKVDEGEDETE